VFRLVVRVTPIAMAKMTARPSIPLPLFVLACLILRIVQSFHPSTTRPITHRPLTTTTTTLHGLKKGGKFGKQKDLAAKMEEAKRQRQQADGDADNADAGLTEEEIQTRNDRKRFESLLDSFDSSSLGNNYMTTQQQNENADAYYRGVERLYEGDPAPSSPFAELCSIHNGEAIGKSGIVRYVPWENSAKSGDYIVVITDPRPKSTDLRSAIRKLCGGEVSQEILQRCIIINPDSPGENRKFLKKIGGSVAEKLTVLIDEDLAWMREYTALGEEVRLSHGILSL
jgi:hypothetical protein